MDESKPEAHNGPDPNVIELAIIWKSEPWPYPVYLKSKASDQVLCAIPTDDPKAKPYTILFDFPDPKIHQAALGEFIDQWSLLENWLNRLIVYLFGIDPGVAQSIMASMGAKELRELATKLADNILDDKDKKRLGKMLERMTSLATTRNTLIHGQRRGEIILGMKNGAPSITFQTTRYQSPPNKKQAEELNNLANQKIRGRYCYTTDRIAEKSEEVRELRGSLSSLVNDKFPQSTV